MGKPSPPDPPDMTAVADASEKAAELSYQMAQEQLAWAKEQYAMDKETIDAVVGQMLEDMAFSSENAIADRERYETVFQPLEDQFIQQVQEYATPQRASMEAGRAQAGVAQQFEAARNTAQQELESFGINPADTRYGALDIGTRTAEAAASASAGTEAYRQVEQEGRALLEGAINIGKGYPGQAAQQQALTQGAGGTAAGATTSGTQAATGAMGMPANYMQTGNQAVSTWGNTLNQSYANEVNAYQAQLSASGGWGSALGSLAGMAMIPFMSEGGVVPNMAEGGAIPTDASPSNGAIPDDTLVAATPGEFMLPQDVVRWKGEEHYFKEIDNVRRKKFEMLTGAIPDRKAA